MSPHANAEISTRGIAAYAAGSLGTGVFSTVPTVLLLYFCTEVLAIPAALAGVIVFVPKAWSILWDPFVGAWSDRHRGPYGRRRPFLLVGNIGMTAAFFLLFSPPVMDQVATALWMGITYFALATVYSIFAVPYIALSAELASTKPARAKLVSWRMTVGMAGVLLGASISAFLVAGFGGGRTGYSMMAGVIGCVCAVAMCGPFLIMKGRERQEHGIRDAPFLRHFRSAFANRQFIALCLSYLLQLSAVGLFTSSIPYLVTKILGRAEEDVGTVMGVMLGLSILTIITWANLAKRIGEHRVLIGAILFFCAAGATMALSATASLPWAGTLTIVALAGVAFAGIQVIPFTLLAEMAHRASNDDNASTEATFTGIWTAVEKLGLAIGPALTAVCLVFAGVDGLPVALGMTLTVLLLASIPAVLRSKERPRELPSAGA